VAAGVGSDLTFTLFKPLGMGFNQTAHPPRHPQGWRGFLLAWRKRYPARHQLGTGPWSRKRYPARHRLCLLSSPAAAPTW